MVMVGFSADALMLRIETQRRRSKPGWPAATTQMNVKAARDFVNGGGRVGLSAVANL